MGKFNLLTTALLTGVIMVPAAMAQTGAAVGGGNNLPSQRITQGAANGSGAQLTVSPANVRQVQQALNRLGYSAGPVNGRWDQATARAVLHFQQARGLEPTGNLNRVTLSALGVSLGGGGGGGANVAGGNAGNLSGANGGGGAGGIAGGAGANGAAGAGGANGAVGNGGAAASGAVANGVNGANGGVGSSVPPARGAGAGVNGGGGGAGAGGAVGQGSAPVR